MDKLLVLLEGFMPLTVLLRLIIAAIMGGLIGIERGRHGRAAGLRTHILICIGAAMTSLTSLFLNQNLGFQGDVSRLSAQVISGIGFIGAGTILIRNSSVITGLTTAAGMWATATIGIAVGYGFYSGAVCAAIICFISVTLLGRLERKHRDIVNCYLELENIADVENAIEIIRSIGDDLMSYDIVPPKTGKSTNIGISFITSGKEFFESLKEDLTENCAVAVILAEINS